MATDYEERNSRERIQGSIATMLMLAVAAILGSQIDGLAAFAATVWFAGGLMIVAALLLAVRRRPTDL